MQLKLVVIHWGLEHAQIGSLHSRHISIVVITQWVLNLFPRDRRLRLIIMFLSSISWSCLSVWSAAHTHLPATALTVTVHVTILDTLVLLVFFFFLCFSLVI